MGQGSSAAWTQRRSEARVPTAVQLGAQDKYDRTLRPVEIPWNAVISLPLLKISSVLAGRGHVQQTDETMTVQRKTRASFQGAASNRFSSDDDSRSTVVALLTWVA
mmetsp:Transcript_41736/g.110457  ORF Transcript_41736/g.110457 Transcript_41736/m.110457 type:complete len:106 (+) Transcript_41736:891-1208(+)